MVGASRPGDADARLAERSFQLYEQHMLNLYRHELREVPGAHGTFRWHFGSYRHAHLIRSVAYLPGLFESEGWL
ncbi:MAG: hypothetical protein DCC67_00905 [Planctomycetota bacterium]|nr:MAG: hypothetical protein DCC67_00905 [Planctomycetota bacterium]